MEIQRSPFNMKIVELLVAIATILAARFGFHAFLWSSQPWPGDYPINEPLPSWFLVGREELFNTYVGPISIILGLSSLFLVRGIENQNVRYFSRFIHFALAWPLLLFPLVTFFSFLSLYCFPLGLILSILALAESTESRVWWGSIFTTAWNIVCTFIAGSYFASMWNLLGD